MFYANQTKNPLDLQSSWNDPIAMFLPKYPEVHPFLPTYFLLFQILFLEL